MEQKQTFRILLAMLAIMLVILPFVTTFNSALTELVNRFGLYQIVQQTVVPFESRLVVGTVRVLGIKAYLGNEGERASLYMLKDNEYLPVEIQWNCLGWQSLLLLFISFFVGFQGHYSKLSKTECFVIGLLGTFLVNIFRMVFIIVGIYHVDTVFAFLIHDYFAALTTIVWLFFFWWFSYEYVLDKHELQE